jgi:hypothetical protein
MLSVDGREETPEILPSKLNLMLYRLTTASMNDAVGEAKSCNVFECLGDEADQFRGELPHVSLLECKSL